MRATIECQVGRCAQRGVALTICLIVLTLLAIFALAGLSSANAELVMAGNEQFAERASNAASAGVEYAIARLATLAADTDSQDQTAAVDGSVDTFSTHTRFVGIETGLRQPVADQLIGRHYVIESTGRSMRGAQDVQIQGALVVAVNPAPPSSSAPVEAPSVCLVGVEIAGRCALPGTVVRTYWWRTSID